MVSIMKIKFNPIYSLIRTITLLITGRLHFPRENIGKILIMEDGQKFCIFRQVIVDTAKYEDEKHTSIFKVRFITVKVEIAKISA